MKSSRAHTTPTPPATHDTRTIHVRTPTQSSDQRGEDLNARSALIRCVRAGGGHPVTCLRVLRFSEPLSAEARSIKKILFVSVQSGRKFHTIFIVTLYSF